MGGARPPRRRGVLSDVSPRRQQLAAAAAAAVAATAVVLLGGIPTAAVPAPPGVAVTLVSAPLAARQQEARMGPTWSFAPDGRRKFRVGNLCAETGLCTAEYRYPCSSRPEGTCSRTVTSRCLWRCSSNSSLGGAQASGGSVPDVTTGSDGEVAVPTDAVFGDGLEVNGDEVSVPVLSTQQVDGGENGNVGVASTPVAPLAGSVSSEPSVEQQPDVSVSGVPIDVAAPEVTAGSDEDAVVPTDGAVEDALDAEGDAEGTTVLPTPALPTDEGSDGSNGAASAVSGVPDGVTAPEVTAGSDQDVVVPTDAAVEDADEVGGDDENAVLLPTVDADVPELTADPAGNAPELTTGPAVDAADPTELPEETADEAAATNEPSSVPYTFGDGYRTCKAETIRTRRDIRTYSAEELSALTTAWATLYESSTLTDFTAIHVAAHHVAHGGAAFLPWHTLFLLELEAALRSISPELTLPYWPWAADAEDLAAAPVWAASTFGRAATGDCIVDGKFFGVTGSRGRCVLRGFTSISGGIRPVAVVQQGTIDQAVVSTSGGYAAFAAAVETFHNELHVSLAGDMGVGYSPDDPTFWAHHAYVDLWWADRQQRSPDEYSGTHRGVPVSTTDVLWPFNVTVADVLALPCVRYAPVMDAATVSRQAETPVVNRTEAEALVARREAIVGPPSIEFAVRMGDDRETAVAARGVAVAVQVEAAVSGTIDVSAYERVEQAPVGGYFNGSEDVARGPDGVPNEPVPVLYARGDAEYPPRPPKNAVGAPAFSTGAAPAYPSGTAPAYPSGTAPAYPSGTAPAYPSGTAPAYPSGTAPAYPSGTAPAYPSGTAPAYPSGTAPAYPSGTAPAYPSGTAPAYLSGTAPAYPSGAVPTYSLQKLPAYSPQQAPAYPAAGAVAPTPSSTPKCSTLPGETHAPVYASGAYPNDVEAAPANTEEAASTYSEEDVPAYSEEGTPTSSELDATPAYSDEEGSGDYSVDTPAYQSAVTPASSPEATPASYDGADPYTYPGSTPDHTACADDSDDGVAGLLPSMEPTESPLDEIEGEGTATPGGYEDTWTGGDPYGVDTTAEPASPADGDSGATVTPTAYPELVGRDSDASPGPYSGPYDGVDDEAAATSSPYPELVGHDGDATPGPYSGPYDGVDDEAAATSSPYPELVGHDGDATPGPYSGPYDGVDDEAAATSSPYPELVGHDGDATPGPYSGPYDGVDDEAAATPSASAGSYGPADEAASTTPDAPSEYGEERPVGTATAEPYAPGTVYGSDGGDGPVVTATAAPYAPGTVYGSDGGDGPVVTATAAPYAPGTVYGSDGGDGPVVTATAAPYAPGTVYGSDGGDGPVVTATAAPYAPGTVYGSDGGDGPVVTATAAPYAPGTVYGSDGGDGPVVTATAAPYAPGTVYGSDGGDGPVVTATAAPYAPGTVYGSDGGDGPVATAIAAPY
ncbi:hypothetical protein MMPV_001276 [Pyropia vietnamensis]